MVVDFVPVIFCQTISVSRRVQVTFKREMRTSTTLDVANVCVYLFTYNILRLINLWMIIYRKFGRHKIKNLTVTKEFDCDI